ncbi:hypothetical protein ACVIWV_008701 [Bradyrhizobium diazoefficiens]
MIITRGGVPAYFNSFFMSRCAARSALDQDVENEAIFWSTARQSQVVCPRSRRRCCKTTG